MPMYMGDRQQHVDLMSVISHSFYFAEETNLENIIRVGANRSCRIFRKELL